jgi:phage/plasmid-like protein (TIGR03299 family)
LNWNVKTEPVFTAGMEAVEARVTRRDSDNKILGVVGKNYEPLQNTQAFDFFQPFLDSKLAAIETAGSLRGGKRVFVLAKINRDPSVIVAEDIVEKYVLLSNSHDGSTAVRVGFTPIRVVCQNTLAMAHGNESSALIRVRHTSKVRANVEAVREIMDVANSRFEATAAQYRFLASREINAADLEKYVKIVFGKEKLDAVAKNLGVVDVSGKRLMAEIVPLFESGRGNSQNKVRGTYWAAYNAVTEYLQYYRGSSEDLRLDSLWFGQAGAVNKKALEVAMRVAA